MQERDEGLGRWLRGDPVGFEAPAGGIEGGSRLSQRVDVAKTAGQPGVDLERDK